MAIDFADLAVRVNYSDVPKATRALEDLASASGKAEQSTNRLNATSVAGTRGMGAWSAIQAEAAGHVGEHSIAIGRLERLLASMVGHALGANAAVEALASGLLKFSVGTLESVGVLAGLAAVVALYEKMTEGSRKAREESDKMTQSLVEQARAARAATVAGAEDLKLIAEINLQSVKRERGVGFSSVLSTLLHGGSPTLSDADAEAQSKRIADAQTGVERATANWIQAVTDANEKAAQKAEEAFNKAQAAAAKAQQEAIRYTELMARTYGSLGTVGHDFRGPEIDPLQRMLNAERGGREMASRSLAAVGVEGFSMPHVGLDDGLTDLQKAIRDLILPFDAAKDAATRLAKALTDSHHSVESGLANFGITSTPNESGGRDFHFNPKAIGQGAEAGAAGAIGDALNQFSPQALTYQAVSSGINYIVKGFTDMALSMLDGGQAAEAYRLQMKRNREEFAASFAAFQKNDLAAEMANIAAAADGLRQSFQQTFDTMDLVRSFANGTTQQIIDQRNAIDAQEQRNKALAEKQARDQEQYSLEDLQVRNLRALGRNDEADRLAFQEQQQREFTAAQDKAMADGVITLAEQLYLNTLKTTENNELIAFNNGLLADALRNAPSGFFVEKYLSDFAVRTPPPEDSGPTDWTQWKDPKQGGTSSPPGSRFPNQGGGGISAPTQATFDFSGTTININGNRSGEEMLADFKAALKKRQAATVGPYGTLSDALDRL